MSEPSGFKVLIEALEIFAKYSDTYAPTHCEHDMLSVMVDPDDVTPEDKDRLEDLGFHESRDYDNFYSYRFGSA